MDIGSVGSDYINQLNQTVSKTLASGSDLEKKLKSDKSEATDEELMGVCKEFEAYFIEQVFKEMKKSVNITQASDNATQSLLDYYGDNLITEYAKGAADQQENGLAKMLYDQMKRNYDL
ncbi:MAG: rod-binding protein [Lachnospiraceae bacterium]|nr:rod-binding protein [Lachnospiraceae bacterium]